MELDNQASQSQKLHILKDADVLSPTNKQRRKLEHSDTMDLSNNVIEVLKAPPNARSAADIHVVMRATMDIPFFAGMILERGEEFHEQFCLHMTHASYEAGETVFEAGSIGKTYYVILKGSVAIRTKNLVFQKDADGNEQATLVSKDVNILGRGDSFGELALLKDIPRTATVVCQESTDFGVLTKDKYMDIMADMDFKKMQQKIEFFMKVSFLTPLSKSKLTDLLFAIKESTYSYKNYVYQINEPSTAIYIVVSGEFRLYIEVDPPAGSKSQQKVEVEVSIVGEHQIFGDEEVLQNLPGRFCSARCTSATGKVYVLTKKEFRKRISDNYSRDRDYIMKYYNEWREQKFKWRKRQIEELKEAQVFKQNSSQEALSAGRKKSGYTEEVMGKLGEFSDFQNEQIKPKIYLEPPVSPALSPRKLPAMLRTSQTFEFPSTSPPHGAVTNILSMRNSITLLSTVPAPAITELPTPMLSPRLPTYLPAEFVKKNKLKVVEPPPATDRMLSKRESLPNVTTSTIMKEPESISDPYQEFVKTRHFLTFRERSRGNAHTKHQIAAQKMALLSNKPIKKKEKETTKPPPSPTREVVNSTRGFYFIAKHFADVKMGPKDKSVTSIRGEKSSIAKCTLPTPPNKLLPIGGATATEFLPYTARTSDYFTGLPPLQLSSLRASNPN